MIIKRVAQPDHPHPHPHPNSHRHATPRVIIKIKKTARLQPCQPIAEEAATEPESNSFSDSDYFSHQHTLLPAQQHSKQPHSHPFHVLPLRTNPKQNYSHNAPHPRPSRTADELSRNLFLEFLRKQPVQAAQLDQIPPPESYSERHRKYSCPPTRKDSLEPPTQLANKDRFAQKEVQQLGKIDLKLGKGNHSCQVVNPYTHKQYFHQRVTHSSNQSRRKNFRSLDYSIIKPNEIRTLPFSSRNERTLSKRKTERKQFPELIAALKRKEQLWAQRARARDDMRLLMHTSYVNRRREAVVEEKNEVQPWEVELQAQPNLADIL